MESPALTMFAVSNMDLVEIALKIQGAKSIGETREIFLLSRRIPFGSLSMEGQLHYEVSGAQPVPGAISGWYQKTPPQILQV